MTEIVAGQSLAQTAALAAAGEVCRNMEGEIDLMALTQHFRKYGERIRIAQIERDAAIAENGLYASRDQRESAARVASKIREQLK